LIEAGAPIDVFGVGTELATSADAPSVAAVYKMAEITSGTERRLVAKYSSDKHTLPGAKQVFRYSDGDVIGLSDECQPARSDNKRAKALLRPVILGGNLVEELPTTSAIRDYCAQAVRQLSPGHTVEYSRQMLAVSEQLRNEPHL